MRSDRLLFTLAISLISVPLALGQTAVSKHRLTVGTDKATFEKFLGKPLSAKTSEGTLICQYPFKGTRGIQVYYNPRGGGLPPTVTSSVQVYFNKGTSWEQALRVVGFDPSKMKLVKSYFPGYRQVVGDPLKFWNVYFVDLNAKYPDGKLINAQGGLPMLDITGRELGDKSPD